MAYKFNPLTGNLDDYGPVLTGTGTVSAAADGTAALPGIAFTNDLNTGIYRPGADQLALSTNGNGRLFIDSSGNINIGGSDIGVLGSAGRRLAVGATSAGNNGSVTIFSSTSGLGYLAFGDGTAGSDSYRGLLEYDHTSDSLRTYTAGTQRMAITSTGQLSHIGAGSSGSPAVSFSGSAASNSLVVDSSSRVGIGTSAPQSQLQVLDQIRVSNSAQSQGSLVLGDGGSTAFNVGIARWNGGANAAGAGGIGYFSQGTGNVGGHYFYTGDAAAGSQTARMVILPGGNVGIGTTSPARLFHVSGSGTTARLTSSTSTSSLEFETTGGFAYVGAKDGPNIYVETNGSERLRVDSSGRLLVGTNSTSSVNRLIVQSSSDAPTGAGTLLIARGDNAPLTTNVLGVLRFGGSTHVNSAEISAFRDGGTWTAGSSLPTGLTFSTTADGASSPTERLRITSAGVLQVADAGNIAVGTTTGTKIGTATTQKLGFFNKTPVVQPAAVADATDAASVITQLNALLARMRDLGLIAT